MAGTWYLQRGRSDPLGPFSTEEILEGLAHGEIPDDSLVREIAATAWLPFAAIPEFREALALVRSSTPDQDDEARLAPKAGPAWRSASDRHRKSTEDAPPGAAPAKPRPRPAQHVAARPEPIAQSSATIGGLIAALGIVWAFVRLGALLTPPAGWIPIVDRFHMVRDGSIADLALAGIAYPLLFAGIYGARMRAPFGVPLVRAVARVICVGNVVIAAVTIARLQGSPRLAEVGSAASVISLVTFVPVLLAACAAFIVWLFPAPSSDVVGPNETLLSALVAAAFIGVTFVLFGRFVDVVQLAPEGAAFVYTDTTGLRLGMEARQEGGVVGLFKLDDSRRRGFIVETPTRGRFVADFPFSLAEGQIGIGREVELLEGPRAGTHVFLPPEDARIR